jgi:hypothetical protein
MAIQLHRMRAAPPFRAIAVATRRDGGMRFPLTYPAGGPTTLPCRDFSWRC